MTPFEGILKSIKELIRKLFSPVYILDKKMNALTKAILAKHVFRGSQWIDVGCGLQPFLSSFENAHCTGLDIEISGRDISL